MLKCSTKPWSERGNVLMEGAKTKSWPMKSVRILLLILMNPGFHSRELQKGQPI